MKLLSFRDNIRKNSHVQLKPYILDEVKSVHALLLTDEPLLMMNNIQKLNLIIFNIGNAVNELIDRINQ